MCLPDTEGLPAMVWVCEKPQEENLDPMFHQAWGLLCWQKAAGHALLKAQLESGSSHAWHQLEMTYESFKLKSFEDVTRKRLQLDRL